MSKTPSKFLLRFLHWFCPEHLIEEIEGDLFQKFDKDVSQFGIKKARRKFGWNVIKYFRLGIVLRNKFSISSNASAMTLANIRFNLRHLGRQKLNTSLHILGLTLGISACLLIALNIRYELSFDSYHNNAQRIYRVNSVWKEGGKQYDLYATPVPLAEVLRKEATGLDKVTRVLPQFSSVIEVNPQKIFKQENILIAEPEFLDIFEVHLMQGNGHQALQTPYQALLSEEVAHKFFGDEDPIGKILKFRNNYTVTVAGVFKDLPSNTGLRASILISYVSNEAFLDNGDTWYFGGFDWAKLSACTYVKLQEGTKLGGVESQLLALADRNINTEDSLSNMIRGGFELQALSDIHFDTKRFGGGPWVNAIDKSWLLFFAMVGLITLILACINFVNLFTAQSVARTREVGIRKSMGAKRSQLIKQFLGEALIITILAGIFSLVVARLALPILNNLLEKQVAFFPFWSPGLIVLFIMFIVFTSLLAGVYPAWIAAKLNPVMALKSGWTQVGGGKTLWTRKVLVVFQFVVCAVLILVVLVIAQQVEFMRNKELGFQTKDIISVSLPNYDKGLVLSNELRKIKGVEESSFSRTTPISDDHWWNTIGLTTSSERYNVCAIHADENYYKVYDLHILSGHVPLNAYNPTSEDQKRSKVVVNEELLKVLGLGSPDEAIGKIFWWGDDTEIVGVVANFNTDPLKYGLMPTIIAQNPEVYRQVNIKMTGGNSRSETLASVELAWEKIFQDGVYEFKFLSDQINSFYKEDARLYGLFKLFSGLAILISCLGLWGLVTFTSLQRTKEFGIRKVLGASAKTILFLLTRDYFRLILIAYIIAAPIAFYFTSGWLQRFAFRIDLGWGVFIITGIVLGVVTISTMCYQALKVALTNPTHTLRAE